MKATVHPYEDPTWAGNKRTHWHVVIELPDRTRIEIFTTKKAARQRAAQINGGKAH